VWYGFFIALGYVKATILRLGLFSNKMVVIMRCNVYITVLLSVGLLN